MNSSVLQWYIECPVNSIIVSSLYLNNHEIELLNLHREKTFTCATNLLKHLAHNQLQASVLNHSPWAG